jgi:hypothetical protein
MSTFEIGLFTTIGVFTCIFIACIIFESKEEFTSEESSENFFKAPETGMYAVTSSLGGGVDIIECDGNTSYNITYTTSSIEGKVFYNKETDTIIDGNSLVELGDL